MKERFGYIFIGVLAALICVNYLYSTDIKSLLNTREWSIFTHEYSPPKNLIIPKLGINAEVESVGIETSGRMAAPKDTNNTGWLNTGTIPGEKGSAVINGHLDSLTGPAVFYNLNKLEKGDIIFVKDKKDNTLSFVVIKKEVYEDTNFPVNDVFTLEDARRLNLITCEGIFNRATKSYSQRLVIYSVLTKNQ